LLELLIAGAAIGLLLGVLGAGGAIFTAPILILVFDLSVHEATTVSLVVVLVAALSGLVGRRGTQSVRWREGSLFGAVGLVAAAFGSWAATLVSGTWLTGAFALLLVVAAAAMWRQPDSLLNKQGRKPMMMVVGAALVIGLVTGFFGVGGGFVIVPALVLFLGFDIAQATATGLLVIGINVVVALAVRGVEYLDWSVALPMAVAAVAGSFIGARIAPHLPQKRVRQAFAVLMVGAALLLGIQLLGVQAANG
jgi:uncharacterized membrane protein YfcA